MSRGFTLPELSIAMVIMALLFTVAIPDWSRTIDSYRIKSTARELQGFFLLAKSEAVRRNRDIWIQLYLQAAEGQKYYRLQLLDNAPSLATGVAGKVIAQTEGNIAFFQANRRLIKVKGINGKFARSGHLQFGRQADGSNSVKLIFHHITGRVRLCSVKEAGFGYPLC